MKYEVKRITDDKIYNELGEVFGEASKKALEKYEYACFQVLDNAYIIVRISKSFAGFFSLHVLHIYSKDNKNLFYFLKENQILETIAKNLNCDEIKIYVDNLKFGKFLESANYELENIIYTKGV